MREESSASRGFFVLDLFFAEPSRRLFLRPFAFGDEFRRPKVFYRENGSCLATISVKIL